MAFKPWFLLVVALTAQAAVIPELRGKLSAGDLSSADAIVAEYRQANGETPEYAAAVAWLARGALSFGHKSEAAAYLAQAKALVAKFGKTANVEEDGQLLGAAGTCVEVEGLLMAARGQKPQAIAFLTAERSRWKSFQIRARIEKTINLLQLEGRSAPVSQPEWAGKPVMLFLWAPWCGDCKAQAPAVARVIQKYVPKGLLVVAPTRHYGYLPGVEYASAAQEDAYIQAQWREFMPGQERIAHPVSDPLMIAYGASSTPTIVLIDTKGIVRMYKPYRMSEAALSRRVEALLAGR